MKTVLGCHHGRINGLDADLAVWNRFGVMSATQEQRCGQNEVPLKNAACRLDVDFEIFGMVK